MNVIQTVIVILRSVALTARAWVLVLTWLAALAPSAEPTHTVLPVPACHHYKEIPKWPAHSVRYKKYNMLYKSWIFLPINIYMYLNMRMYKYVTRISCRFAGCRVYFWCRVWWGRGVRSAALRVCMRGRVRCGRSVWGCAAPRSLPLPARHSRWPGAHLLYA